MTSAPDSRFEYFGISNHEDHDAHEVVDEITLNFVFFVAVSAGGLS
jgi:hypothetical protein